MDPLTIKAYDEQALEYDRETAGFWDDFPAEFIQSFTSSLMRPARVLNVGSGPGRDGALLFAAGLNVICLDGSRKMVSMSKERGLWSVQGDFLHLPFADGNFDGGWAYTALLHVKKSDFPRALAELARVLKPSGTLALGMIKGTGEGYLESMKVSLPRWFAYYDIDELARHLTAVGLIVKTAEEFKPGHRYTYLNILAEKN